MEDMCPLIQMARQSHTAKHVFLLGAANPNAIVTEVEDIIDGVAQEGATEEIIGLSTVVRPTMAFHSMRVGGSAELLADR